MEEQLLLLENSMLKILLLEELLLLENSMLKILLLEDERSDWVNPIFTKERSVASFILCSHCC